jgi:methionyl aminopeptidase
MTEETLPKMRASCQLAANILKEVCAAAKPGVTTKELDDLALELTLKNGAYPATLNYPNGHTDPRNPVITKGGFPASICTSLNEVVCHGIPSADQVLKDGDIMNIDYTCILDGYFGDNSRMVCIGEVPEETQKLVDTAYECMMKGIETVRPGSRLYDIGKAIQDHAHQFNYGVVREYTGHGVGTVFHADPQVCHYPTKKGDAELIEGMTFTIEPMINLGTWQTILDKNDGWTVYTLDGKLSAQWEHTLVVTSDGHEILTLPTT